MSSKDTMRRVRADENSKNPSISTVRSSSNRVKTQSLSKGDSTEIKKKLADNKATVEKSTKTAVKTSSTGAKSSSGATKKNGETNRETGTIAKTQSKAPPISSKQTVASTHKVSRATADNVGKSRTERKSDGEKRGISSIYMPKSSVRVSKTSGPTEGHNVPSSTRSRNAPNPTSTRTKDIVKVASTKTKDNTVKATSSRTKFEAPKTVSTRTKDNSANAANNETKEATAKPKNQYTVRQTLPSRERRRSRTLSPSEVRVLHSAKPVTRNENSTVATASKNEENSTAKIDTDDEYEYEDDFESYESDFEECTDNEVSEVSEVSSKSAEAVEAEPIEMHTEKPKTKISSVESRKVDEERMLDSGHYELAEARRRAARVETVTVPRESKAPTTGIIVQPSISPYREERTAENKSLPSSMDEGFEDSRSGDFAKSPPLSQIAFVDFRNPAKNLKAAVSEKTTPKVLSRGQKLLEMIKLDVVEWSILESKPVAYEEFIRTHGKFNTRQICTQTNEDNLDIETQTDAIEHTNKWTQFPAKCRTVLKNDEDLKLFNMERVGVGSENDEASTNVKSRAIYDVLQLNEFVSQAGKVVLALLDARISVNDGSSDNVHEFPFSESVVKLSIDSVTFLAGRSVTMIHYSNVSNRVLLTIHAAVDEEIETARDEDFVTDCSIGCVWDILQPSRPLKLFYSPSPITACCFHSTSYNIVLGGLEDGSISLWDLAEEETWHRKIFDKANNFEWCVRSSTYSSIGNFDESGHDSEIVALRVLSKIEGETADVARNQFMPIQICSLDANGLLIIWSVFRNMSGANVDDLGLSWWGNLRLLKSQEISLHSKKASERLNHLKGFSDMHVDRLDTNALYIATNTTNILHATRIGKHANPPAYKSSEMDWCGDTMCIESCPFDQPYFLVGCADGTLRLHSTATEKPLLQLKNEDCKVAVKTVQWSRSKPLTFYVLDVNSKIHVWDLGSSDIYPQHTIPTEKWAHVNSIQLSPCRTAREMTNQYMALASDNGCVEVHRLKEEFCYRHKDALNREMSTFLRYVEIL